MAMVSMRQLLDEAAAGGYGVGAFNVSNMEQIQADLEAARETPSPVIIQLAGRALVHQRPLPLPPDGGGGRADPEIPVALHQDHGNSPATRISAIEQGFTSVMMDGSLLDDGKTPADFAYNVQVTREVVEHAHAVGVTVEGELGTLGGIEDGVGSGEIHLTDPDQAVEFVERTGIDALAVAIGTSHGAYKFSRKPDGKVLAMNLIQEIHEKLPDNPPRHARLVVGAEGAHRHHQPVRRRDPPDLGRPGRGDSARHPPRRPQDQRRHRSRLAITGAIRKAMAEIPAFDPRSYLKPARAAMQKVIVQRMTQFGQAGHAGDYEPRSLAEMRDFYAGAAALVGVTKVIEVIGSSPTSRTTPSARRSPPRRSRSAGSRTWTWSA